MKRELRSLRHCRRLKRNDGHTDEHDTCSGQVPARERNAINKVEPHERYSDKYPTVDRLDAACRSGMQRQHPGKDGQ